MALRHTKRAACQDVTRVDPRRYGHDKSEGRALRTWICILDCEANRQTAMAFASTPRSRASREQNTRVVTDIRICRHPHRRRSVS
jgi:hypothetical protein